LLGRPSQTFKDWLASLPDDEGDHVVSDRTGRTTSC
jgi:hypothetical protein